MALRDQPYLPLYVQDFLTDEKLANCSAESTGVYIRLMCLMHKSHDYGKIVLRDKFKITSKSIANFSEMLSRQMPYREEEIERSLDELLSEGVICIDGDTLYQQRMVRDGELSEARSRAGRAGGRATRNSATRKNYNEEGFVYVAEDCEDETCHKVGITKDLRNRLNGLRSKSGRDMKYVFTAKVLDMGTTEDNILSMLNGVRDGEWIYNQPVSAVMEAVNKCIKIKNKSQANQNQITENENENIYTPVNKKDKGGLGEEENPFDGELGEAFDDWLAYKKEKRQNYKPRGLKSLVSQIQKSAEEYGDAATADAIRMSMASNYQGIVFDRLSKGSSPRKTAKKTGDYKGEDFWDD